MGIKVGLTACVIALLPAGVLTAQESNPNESMPAGALARLRPPVKHFGLASFSVSPDGRFIAGFGVSKGVVIWNLDTKKIQTHVTLPEIPSLAPFSPNGEFLAMVMKAPGFDPTPAEPYGRFQFQLWETTTGKMRRSFCPNGLPDGVGIIAYSPKGDVICVGNFGSFFSFFPDDERKQQPLSAKGLWITGMTFAPNGKYVAIFAAHNRYSALFLFDPYSMEKCVELFAFTEHLRIVSLQFSADGRRLAFLTQLRGDVAHELKREDRSLQIIDVPTGQLMMDRLVYTSSPFALTRDGRIFACLVQIPENLKEGRAPENQLHFVDVFTQKVLHVFRKRYDMRLEFVPNRKILASYDSHEAHDTITLWDISKVKPDTEPPTRFNDKQLSDLWDRLAHKEARKALEAGRQLERDPEGTVAFFAKRLEPLPKVSAEQLRQWLAEQESDDEAVQGKAEKELAKLWRGAAKELKKAQADAFDVGTKGRLGALILWTHRPIHVPETLQRMRAIEVLEHIGTPAARKVLERMASGEARYPETQDAIESLERLKAVKK